MRTLLVTLLALGAAGIASAQTVYVSPDVPTDPAAGAFRPWDVLRQSAGVIGPVPVFTVPGDPAIDALHRMDKPGNWLFSVEAPNDLAGTLAVEAQPRDVVRFDAGAFSFFFCGGSAVDPVPVTSNVDAVYLDSLGGDAGDLIVSFDVPTTIAGATYFPADLVRYAPTSAVPSCADWKIAGLEFDSTSAGVATSSNVIGADAGAGRTLLSMDVPSDLFPSLGPPTYVPGQIASWDGAAFDLFETMSGWATSSHVDALSCQANPGRLTDTLRIGRVANLNPDIRLVWGSSCSQGAEDYGIYEGTIGAWYSHSRVICTDAGGDLTESLTPAGAAQYYLVVPHNVKEEGSYATSFIAGLFQERPQAAGVANRCVTDQTITACP